MKASGIKVDLYFIRSTRHEGYYLHPDGEMAYKLDKGRIGAAVWTWARGKNFLREFPQYGSQLELEKMPPNSKTTKDDNHATE